MMSSQENGFTFIEVMVAIVVLGIGICALYAMQTTTIRGNAGAIALTELSTRTAGQLEHIVGADFNDDILADSDGDGTGQDSDADGIDDDDDGDDVVEPEENFGLHHAAVETADGHAVIDDRTTMYWNVAVDVPAPHMKTIHVIVITNKFGRDKRVEFEYYKDDVM